MLEPHKRSAPEPSGHTPLDTEHRDLAARAARLELVLLELAHGRGADAAPGDARFLLMEFRARLLEHLTSEEEQGILELAAGGEPRFARQVAFLHAQHADLRDLVADVAARALAGSSVFWGDVHAGFAALSQLLRDHDRAETELLQRAYLEDLGGRG